VGDDVALGRARLAELPGGDEALERIGHLERSWGRRAPLADAGPPPSRGERLDADVVIAGGGLWLLLAPYLARRGLSVVVLDRVAAGRGHREWNISGPELGRLIETGLFTAAEVDELVVARYREGVCRWYQGGSYPVRGVLDHAIDGEALLAAARARALDAGVRLLDGHTFEGVSTGKHGVRVRASAGSPRARVELTARVLVDALGSASPHARFDLGCPTVGGVLEGLAQGEGPDEVWPERGDILVTTEHREDGRQHIWEGFPGRQGLLTTYLFYYARAAALPPSPLLSLYGRFFRTLPRYKRGDSSLQRLTYGIIPGWSRLTPPPSPPAARIALVGDAAARHSPLTFCGFGSMVRSLGVVGDRLARALDDDDLSAQRLGQLSPEPPLLRGVGALALLLAEPRSARGGGGGRGDPAATNRLLDAAFGSLFHEGNTTYGAMLRDELSPRDFARFLRRTSLERPEVYRDVARYLSPRELLRWAGSVAGGALAR
jgi:lycopene cyclase CruA